MGLDCLYTSGSVVQKGRELYRGQVGFNSHCSTPIVFCLPTSGVEAHKLGRLGWCNSQVRHWRAQFTVRRSESVEVGVADGVDICTDLIIILVSSPVLSNAGYGFAGRNQYSTKDLH